MEGAGPTPPASPAWSAAGTPPACMPCSAPALPRAVTGSAARILPPRGPCSPARACVSRDCRPPVPASTDYLWLLTTSRLHEGLLWEWMLGAVSAPPKPGGCPSQPPDPEELGLWVVGNRSLPSPKGIPCLPTGSLPGTVILELCDSAGLPSRLAKEQRCPRLPQGRRHCVHRALITVPVSSQQDCLEAAGPLPVLCSVPYVFQPNRTFSQRLCGDCGLSAAPAHLRMSTWLTQHPWLLSRGWKC